MSTLPTPPRVSLVNGAASGIGRATAHRLHADGHRLGLLDRDEDQLAKVVSELGAADSTVTSHVVDVRDDAAIAAAVGEAVDGFGGLTGVVSCAGVEVLGAVTGLSVEAWQRSIDVNLTGLFLLARHTIPHLEQSHGALVAVASDAGHTGAQGYAAYTAAKHGVVGLIRCLALDHGPQGVRANAVAPGFVETPMAQRIFATAGTDAGDEEFYRRTVPLGRFARPEEIAGVIAHLLGPDAAYTNGSVYAVDGGSTAGYYTPA